MNDLNFYTSFMKELCTKHGVCSLNVYFDNYGVPRIALEFKTPVANCDKTRFIIHNLGCIVCEFLQLNRLKGISCIEDNVEVFYYE